MRGGSKDGDKVAATDPAQHFKPLTDPEEKSLRGFRRLSTHPRVKSFVASAEISELLAEDGAKRKKK